MHDLAGNKEIAMGIIYMATNMVNGKIYIGQTIRTIEQRKSMHQRTEGCTYFKAAINKYGPESFHWDTIDCSCTKEGMDALESWWINYMDSIDQGYNLKVGGESHRYAESTKQKMRAAKLGKKLTEEHKRKIGESGKGRIRSQEAIRKSADASRGRKKTPEEIEKQRAKMIGRKLTDEHKHKCSLSHIGYKHTEEARANMSKAQKGRIVTDEMRKNISIAGMGRTPWNKGKSGYKQPRCTILPVIER